LNQEDSRNNYLFNVLYFLVIDTMQTSTIILLALFATLMFYSSIDAKNVALDDESDEEITNEAARMFVRSMLEEDEDESSLFARKLKPGCVRCAFGISHCCLPNYCQKRTIRRNKCIKVKAPAVAAPEE
jgi:hypothetical protein